MKPVLALHVFSGLCELLGLYLRPLLRQQGRIPDSLDLMLCFAQSGTNMALVKHMARGQWKMTRPSYQAGAIMRPLLTASAIIFERADLHTSSLQIIHAFIYTRCLICIWWKADLLDKHSDSYMMAVFSAAILAMADTPCPAILSKAYILCVAVISLLNHWASSQIEEPRSRRSAIQNLLLDLLLSLGFVDLPSLGEGTSRNSTRDDYCDDSAVQGLHSEISTEARKEVDRDSQTVVDHETGTQAKTPTESPAREISPTNASHLTSQIHFLSSESIGLHDCASGSNGSTTKYAPVPVEDQICTHIILDSRDITVNLDRGLHSVRSWARLNSLSKATRWRSLLSLQDESLSAASTYSDDGPGKIKPESRVLIGEIEVPDDRAYVLESTRFYRSDKTKRALLRKMVDKFKRHR